MNVWSVIERLVERARRESFEHMEAEHDERGDAAQPVENDVMRLAVGESGGRRVCGVHASSRFRTKGVFGATSVAAAGMTRSESNVAEMSPPN